MHQNQKSICVVGLGYIGLPTAALLANNGYNVVGVDLNKHVVDTINKGQIHIVEPDLDAFVHSAVARQCLKAFIKPKQSDIYIICVPTPFHDNGKVPQPNIDYVLDATRSISSFIKPGDVIILESTSPVGTTHKIETLLIDSGVDTSEIYIAYCPERVLPGKIMTELVDNDRIVGGLTQESTKVVSDFYRSFVRGAVLETDAKTAEMCKITENSFRDVNIAFANEISIICSNEGINVWDLIRLANRHPRVNILQPGPGVGGHCIAVDPWFIVARDPENARLIRSAREVNNYKTLWVIEQIKIAINDAQTCIGRRPIIACLGLAFKPDIDDLRESPALDIVTALQHNGIDLIVVEPNIENHETFQISTLDDAFKYADIFVLLVNHRQFRDPNVNKLFNEVKVLDFCGVLAFSGPEVKKSFSESVALGFCEVLT
jgi:UDP-N-acetyl-D-mannosaminuronic acid dehydrogenase